MPIIQLWFNCVASESQLSTKKPKASKKVFFEEESAIYDEPLTERERIQLCKENDVIYERMNSLVDEIQQLEGKVIEISHLQQVFTEKVLEQEGDIYRINEVAIHTYNTTENVKSGNEQVRQAMKTKSGMRVYVLFFLIVMTFTLLFLHWYNA